MKTIYFTFLSFLSLSAFGQIQHDINKINGTVSNPINDIDSIRFNGSATEMEVVLDNGNVESHTISDIDNVTFDTPYSPGTVHCDPANPTEIVDVTNPATGKTWMDRNLGASQVATNNSDADSYGDLYQWGRAAEGHQCRNSPIYDGFANVKPVTANSSGAWDGKYIITETAPNDWLEPQDDNLWQGVSGVNNPCPSGYRVPTSAELEAERTSWSSNDANGAFSSPLKLTMAGYRRYNGGGLLAGDVRGLYWSSTVSSNHSSYLDFNSSSASMLTNNRAYGFSVRCIKD